MERTRLTTNVQSEPQPSVRDRFASVAKTIKTGTSAAEVEAETAALGKPRVAFYWCNRAGCIDHESEAGSNRMWVSWSKDDGDNDFRLAVMFCAASPGSWQAAMVTVSGQSKAPGAFGTSATPEKVYEDMDVRVPGCMAR